MSRPAHLVAAPRTARRRAQIRRRRATALTCLVLLAALVVLLASSANGPRHLHAQARRPAHGAATRAHARSVSIQAAEDRAIDRLLARQPFISAGGGERHDVALTFDDGPGRYTPQLLNQLERLHAPATFFAIGFMFKWFHASASRELQIGDVIGDHTETHPMMAQLSPQAQQSQILNQTQWVHKYGGPFPRLWRPPYGSYNKATLAILKRLHMLMVLWTVDTDDYLDPASPRSCTG